MDWYARRLIYCRPHHKNGVACTHNPAIKKSLSQNSVYSIFEDVNGSVWIGTYFGGINIAHSTVNSFSIWQNNATANSISNDVVSAVIEDDNKNLWVATEGGGLNYLNTTQSNVEVYKNTPIIMAAWAVTW
ncbi:MAG: two-component regulator propeller domain-containing protein [Ferruginibacter sp.]